VPPTDSAKHEYDEMNQLDDIDDHENHLINKAHLLNDHSEHEEFLHPNMIKETEDHSVLRKTSTPLSKSQINHRKNLKKKRTCRHYFL